MASRSREPQRILQHPRVLREIQKLGRNQARRWAQARTNDERDRRLAESAYWAGYRDAVDTVQRIESEHNQRSSNDD